MTEAEAQPQTTEEILEEARAERERVSAELREINTKLEQSRGELERLVQTNTKVTGELKNLEKDFESVPRTTIKEVYDAVQEAQQRLFRMRGQVDKLQADLGNLRRYQDTLDKLLGVISTGVTVEGPAGEEELPGKAIAIRIIDAQEKERQRLAKQMHDGPAQSLTNFILQAEICQRLFDKDADKSREELMNLKTSASSTFQKVRDFIFDLRPMMLDDLGLLPTVRRYKDAFEEKSGITINLLPSGEDRRLEDYREVIIFRALQELLANVRDHANATEAIVTLDMGADQIRVSVEDNGRGFSTGELIKNPDERETLGLSTLQERVELIGGSVRIDSTSGRGSKIVLTVPAGPLV
jgi:two-component system sensor histidine kinase DegS